jgi:hypothetical protein
MMYTMPGSIAVTTNVPEHESPSRAHTRRCGKVVAVRQTPSHRPCADASSPSCKTHPPHFLGRLWRGTAGFRRQPVLP